MGHRKDDRHYMASVKLGPKGQIVVPGDTLVLLADKKRGIALQTTEKLSPLLRSVFDGMESEEEDEA